MKNSLSLALLLVLVLACNARCAEPATPLDTVARFYEASRQGDVETMKSLIAGPYYKTRKKLLENNADYPQFLRKYYEGVVVQLERPSIGNEKMVAEKHQRLFQRDYVDNKRGRLAPSSAVDDHLAVVNVLLKFPDRGNLEVKLLLDLDADGTWKIVDEVLGH